MKNIIELQKEEQELSELLSENRRQQRELNKLAFVEKHGVDVGYTVEWIESRTPRKGVISGIEFTGVNPVRYRVLLFNSNGKVGKRESKIWSFSLSSIKIISKHS